MYKMIVYLNSAYDYAHFGPYDHENPPHISGDMEYFRFKVEGWLSRALSPNNALGTF
jgi:hypothetical protein